MLGVPAQLANFTRQDSGAGLVICAVILLDTNQLLGKSPDAPVLRMLKKVAEQAGHDLVLPEMVAEEYLAHYRHDVEDAAEKARGGSMVRRWSHAGPVTRGPCAPSRKALSSPAARSSQTSSASTRCPAGPGASP